MIIFIIILAIIVILIGFVLSAYNKLVVLRERVSNAWAQIDTQLKRRFDLIPNIVETVKGYAAHEQGTLEQVIAARNMYDNANTSNEKTNANNMLTDSLKTIFALAENYPDLKANQNFISLQEELSNTENKIATSRQFYNDTVQIYNQTTKMFPTNIIANMFNFKEKDFFNADNEERENVKVSFSK